MAKDRQRETRDRVAGRLEGRPKALRRELSDLEAELERARDRRDRAQARVEALEAIAEQLTIALASAEAARERRRARREEAEAVTTDPGDGAIDPAIDAAAELDPADAGTAPDAPSPAPRDGGRSDSASTRRSRGDRMVPAPG